MALSAITPRDKLQRLIDLGRKALRYWWLVVVFAVVGGGLSMAFALTRPRSFQSWAVLFYQERIQSNLLMNREEQVQRNIGDRDRELLLARAQLEQIISDPKLNPFPELKDPDLAIDKLRNQVRFEARGANAFRIAYTDSDAERSKAVTEKLTKMLQDKDESMRNEQAQATATFASAQKEKAAIELRERELGLAEFLAKHPEFAQDSNQPNSEGASIRAIRDKKVTNTGNNRLYALERQRQRIQARLDAPANAPAIRVVAPATPEKIAAEAVVADTQRELTAAQRELEEAMAKYTEQHPSVRKAQERVAAAKQKHAHAQAAVPPDVETTVAPATPEDRRKLEKDLATLDGQIADEEHNAGKGSAAATAAAEAGTNWVVQLETQHADLRRRVNEQRELVESLANSVFRSQMDADQKIAETGGRLSVVDPAFKPVRPSGPGKTIFLLAGLILFLSLGAGLAIGLAVIDDRLYRRGDIDVLGVAVLAVIPPAKVRSRRGGRS
jgi:uncharacterized protein involved in exopolysaccharide biosynthesis